MSGDSIEFVETEQTPKCPRCEGVLDNVEYRREKVQFGMSGFANAIILICPHCRTMLGAQSW